METRPLVCARCGIQKKTTHGIYCQPCAALLQMKKNWSKIEKALKKSSKIGQHHQHQTKPEHAKKKITLPKVEW
jgi:hypothetical protein